jgi:CBS domain-containing protein
MRKDFLVLEGLETVSNGLRAIKSSNADAILIRKRDEHDELGMVLISDIAKQVLAKDRAPERVNLYEIMTKPVITVKDRMDIRYCARLFEKFGIRTCPVVNDSDEVVGIVNFEDIVLNGLLKDL